MEKPVPDKPTVEEECLDDFPEVVEIDRLTCKGEHPRMVARQTEVAKGEIDETLVRYLEFWEKTHGPL